MRISQDIIIQSDRSGFWILYNVFTFDTLAVATEALQVLGLISVGKTLEDIREIFGNVIFQIYEIGTFSNYKGLLADPTRRIRDLKNWPKPKALDISALIIHLEKNHFLISNESKYNSIFGHKTSLLDGEHLGNFHQQLGQKLFIERRVDPAKWWVEQKFNKEYNLNNTLYKAVQGYFLESFFNKKFNDSHFIIDIGCGIGYYSKLIGKTGATVQGIDPNEEYVRTAMKDCPENISFKVSNIGIPGALDWIESQSADFIFMSDALLFYFVPPNPNQKQEIKVLFSDIKRILKTGGRFFSMEPHGIFWLKPWLGEEERPFTILTEYNNKRFNVSPNYGEIINAFIDEGFIIRGFKEINVDKEFEKTDRRGTYFAKEYPLWWFFELEPEK